MYDVLLRQQTSFFRKSHIIIFILRQVIHNELNISQKRKIFNASYLSQTILTKTKKQNTAAQITTVRVTKATRNKLNALIQLGKADSVDVLLDILLDEYIENNLVKEEKKTFNIVFEVIQKRDR